MPTVHGFAAEQAGARLTPFEYELGDLGPHQVDIDVAYCGICHSDLSMLKNDWGITRFPFVGGHEVTGRVAAVGEHVTHLAAGQRVGLGWFSHSCMTCPQCMSGDHNLCGNSEMTIVGRHGGFADRVRASGESVIALPEGVDEAIVGPLFCGGITVFNPIVQFGVKPTDRVGVVGIGGLGHLALQFLNKWGCEVTAFTSTDAKADEARSLGAHHVVDSRSDQALADVAGRYHFIICTVNVNLHWQAYLAALRPGGRFHQVGAAESITLPVFPMMLGQKQVSGSPVGSPETIRVMLEFCGRHGIAPVTEHYPMSRINDAMQRLADGLARYRVVLQAHA